DHSLAPVDCSGWQSHGCVWTRNMQFQTKFLWLRKPVAIGDQVDGWRVCWIGGSRCPCRVFFVVMVANSDVFEEYVEIAASLWNAPRVQRASARRCASRQLESAMDSIYKENVGISSFF